MDQQKSSIGSIIGTVVILAIIILGGLYFWGKRVEETKFREDLVTDNTTPESNNAEVVAEISSGDDVDSIEADLNSTDLDLSGDIQ
jgi:hypothetical protein